MNFLFLNFSFETQEIQQLIADAGLAVDSLDSATAALSPQCTLNSELNSPKEIFEEKDLYKLLKLV